MYFSQDSLRVSAAVKQELFPWVAREILAGRTVVLPSLEAFPAEAAVDRESARRFGIKSNLCLPLTLGGELPVGVLALNTLRVEREWPEALVKRLQLIAQVFTNALARRRADQGPHESRRGSTGQRLSRRRQASPTSESTAAGCGSTTRQSSTPSCG